MDTLGSNNYTYTFDISGANATALNTEITCRELLKDLILIAGMTEINTITHAFSPQGISVVSLLAESHIALHTWPELQTGYITLTTCKIPSDSFASSATSLILDTFSANDVLVKEL